MWFLCLVSSIKGGREVCQPVLVSPEMAVDSNLVVWYNELNKTE